MLCLLSLFEIVLTSSATEVRTREFPDNIQDIPMGESGSYGVIQLRGRSRGDTSRTAKPNFEAEAACLRDHSGSRIKSGVAAISRTRLGTEHKHFLVVVSRNI